MNAKEFVERLQVFAAESGHYATFREKATNLMDGISAETVADDDTLADIMQSVRQPDMDDVRYVVNRAREVLGETTVTMDSALFVERLQVIVAESSDYANFRKKVTDLITAITPEDEAKDDVMSAMIDCVVFPDMNDMHYILKTVQAHLPQAPTP